MIFYFYGENSFEIAEAVRKIKSQYTTKTGGDFDMDTFEMSERKLSDLLNSLAVVPMFVTSRLLIVRDLASHKLSKEKCEEILQAVSDTTNIVLIDREVDKRSAYFKKMSSLKTAKEFRQRTPAQLVGWLKKVIEQAGGNTDNRTISLLIDAVGNDQWQLNSEVQKLINYNSTITAESIEDLVVPNIDYSVFVMIDNIIRRNPKRAIEIYESLKTRSEPDQKILGAITYQYRVLVLAKDNEGKSNAWVKTTKTSPYAATKAQNIVKKLSMAQLKKAYGLIVEADFNIKIGKQESQDSLEGLIVNLSRI